MELIIVESPTKARTLGRFLGGSYVVEATAGHIKDLPKSKLGIEVENNFKPDFADIPKKKDIIKNLKTEGKKAKIVYLATDPDREGEAIAEHVAEILNADSKIKRIVFHEITKEAVEKAIQNPREVDKNLVDAQIARRVLDRLVGYKLSPLLWKKIRRGLSAGRVQSVAVKLIVEKERAFKSEEYWEIYSKVKGERQEIKDFDIELVKINEKTAEVKNKKDADGIVSDLEKAKYTVFDVRKKEVSKNPYPPFTTSTMTQAASRIFGWSSKRTMSIAQKLYEEGLITYHRTDSFNLSSQAVDTVRKYIEKEFGRNYLPDTPRAYKTQSKVAQEAHEAIRPTNINSKLQIADDKWGHDEETLYKLIWSRFIACQMNPSLYDETVIDVAAAPGNYLLRAGGQIMKFDGWRKVIPAKLEVDSVVKLPEVSKDEKLDHIKTWGEQKFTQPPARYNEASLIKTLEKLGIGRPSTYAPTISTIQIRNYVEKTEGKFFPTSIGEAVTDFLVKNFTDIFEYEFTAGMEDSLDKVANGEAKWTGIIKDFYKPFASKIGIVDKKAERVKIETEKLGKKCPECKEGELVIRIGRFGKFISCSRFPDCKYTEKYLEKVGVKCPECKIGDVIVKKTSKGRKFFGCSRYPECKYASWRSPKKEEPSN
ncbi:MAG: topoisomerase protein [Candidatus Woesebacteria bacterium GW2011_GWC2_40_30]|nr:MAG: topoisomerase protein [Candidatus Woesebacteria bacterium GW2011_GWC2_40_30]